MRSRSKERPPLEVYSPSLDQHFSSIWHTTSRRLADRKVERFEKNITKRGSVPETTAKKGNDYPVGPIVLGFFVFVVIGSCKFLPWWPFI
ncbi:Endoplasmic reticulum [Macleaya cordata]|uniref:Endoplasmic reticulum n=1 Tax=Macleaya cordata TaxID=56857 RepID=A0A200QGH4_MACCD|nr:Endoplasmic reticulum [Macleaya cordata]